MILLGEQQEPQTGFEAWALALSNDAKSFEDIRPIANGYERAAFEFNEWGAFRSWLRISSGEGEGHSHEDRRPFPPWAVETERAGPFLCQINLNAGR